MDDTFEYVEITDPQSNKSFYANIKTGECVWEKPSGLVRLKDPKTQQWWELFDDTSKLPYYFNTETGATEWLRPFDAVIVPLAAIQNSSIGRRVSVAIKRASINTYQPAIQENVRSFGELRNSRIPELSSSINSLVTSNHLQIPSTTPPIQSHINPVHNQYSSRSSPPSNKSSFKVKEAIVSNFEARPEVPGKSLSIAQQKEQSYNSAKSMGISDPVQNLEAAQKMHPMHSLQSLNNDKKEYLNANSSSRKSLPPDLRQTIEQFRIEGYAKKYFSEHRSGMFRRKVPLEQMLHFQKDMLRSPLLILNKSIHKDAIKCFKLIQQIMGDRISHKQSHVECTKNLCDLGILNGVLRDEIYVQVCKQLTENPNQGHYGNSVFRGWQLLCSLSISFPPSKNLENYIKSFIRQNFNSTFPLSSSTFSKDVVNPLNIMARFLYKKMDKICKFGPRGKPMTIAEIERIMGAPF